MSSSNAGFYFNQKICRSAAYKELKKPAMHLLFELASLLRYAKSGRNKKTQHRVYVNNGEIGFTPVLFKQEYGYTKATYQTARNQLIQTGFIKITHPGGEKRGDYTKYKVLVADDLKQEDQRWLQYPTKNWESEIPKNPKNKVGIESRFKGNGQGEKGKSATVENKSHPSRLYPKMVVTP